MKRLLEELSSWLDDQHDGVERKLRKVEAAAVEIQDLLAGQPGASHRALRRRCARERAARRLIEDVVVTSVQLRQRPDGSADVSVNGRPSFRLPRKLTALLSVLLAAPIAADGLVGWQSRADVAASLNKLTGGATLPARLPRLVYKLREAFCDAGENRFLIRSHHQLGLRFALLRGSEGIGRDR